MVRKHTRYVCISSDDDISDTIEDDSIEVFEPRTPSKKPRVDAVTWVEKYTPRLASDVCINPRKAKDVREVFENIVNGKSSCRLLLLSGPAGSSKSTLAKCLANEFFGNSSDGPGYVEYLDSSLDRVSQAHHFGEFMDGCRYLVGRNRRAIIIEDLPNVFHPETLRSFRDCIQDWIFTSPQAQVPLVIMCLTEVENINDNGRNFYNIDNCLTVETVLGRDLLSAGQASGYLQRVKFLPIAKTYLKKSLQKIIAAEKHHIGRAKSQDALTALYESGDIRSSISNLEFMSKSSSGLLTANCTRESQITLFHAVGKVVHSSSKTRDIPSDSEFSSDYESIRSVVDSYHNFGLLHLALLENYQIYNGAEFEVDIAAKIVDSLSLNDTLKSPEAAHDYAIRATRQELSQIPPKSGRTLQMKFPRQFKSISEENKVRLEIANYSRYLCDFSVSFSDVNLIDGFFIPKIKNSGKYQRHHGSKRLAYNRIGGSFRGIFADEDLPVMENENEADPGAKDQFAEDIMQVIRQKEHDAENSDMASNVGYLSDPIEDSMTDRDSDDELNDTLDDDLLQMATQMASSASQIPIARVVVSEDEISDDSQLDLLVSQGRL